MLLVGPEGREFPVHPGNCAWVTRPFCGYCLVPPGQFIFRPTEYPPCRHGLCRPQDDVVNINVAGSGAGQLPVKEPWPDDAIQDDVVTACRVSHSPAGQGVDHGGVLGL